MKEILLCLLPTDIRNCEYRSIDGTCLNSESKCGFKEQLISNNENNNYTRPKRWYEELRQNGNKKR